MGYIKFPEGMNEVNLPTYPNSVPKGHQPSARGHQVAYKDVISFPQRCSKNSTICNIVVKTAKIKTAHFQKHSSENAKYQYLGTENEQNDKHKKTLVIFHWQDSQP